jgi:hypothetical protein
MSWRLARRHGWANWVPEETLLRAVPSHERGRARAIAKGLDRESFVVNDPHRGFKIDHAGIGRSAWEFRDRCGFSEFVIETTLSHFGGFDRA